MFTLGSLSYVTSDLRHVNWTTFSKLKWPILNYQVGCFSCGHELTWFSLFSFNPHVLRSSLTWYTPNPQYCKNNINSHRYVPPNLQNWRNFCESTPFFVMLNLNTQMWNKNNIVKESLISQVIKMVVFQQQKKTMMKSVPATACFFFCLQCKLWRIPMSC